MEVKIGVRDVAREVVLETDQASDAIAEQVAAAVSGGSMLRLTDEKGRTVMVPGDRIGYVELGAPETRRVGFGSA